MTIFGYKITFKIEKIKRYTEGARIYRDYEKWLRDRSTFTKDKDPWGAEKLNILLNNLDLDRTKR